MHAQAIYREALNKARDQCARDPRQEEIAHRIAWSAVKKRYDKVGIAWVRKQRSENSTFAPQERTAFELEVKLRVGTGEAMAIKHILLPLTGEPGDAHTAIFGLALTKALGAHVTVGYEDELGPLDFGRGPSSAAPYYGAFYRQLEEMRRERRKNARSFFHNAVRACSLPVVGEPVRKQASAMWIDDEGGNDAPIAAFGSLTDLVILNAPGSVKSPIAWYVLEKALFGAHRPTLVVPSGCTSVDLSTVLVAWNGSMQAARAVEHGLDLLPANSKVAVLQIGEMNAGRTPPERLMDYLGWHCFKSELWNLPDRKRETGKIILDEAVRVNAGLVIMGAYTHSRARELLLGGVTDFMCRQSTLPVLMAH